MVKTKFTRNGREVVIFGGMRNFEYGSESKKDGDGGGREEVVQQSKKGGDATVCEPKRSAKRGLSSPEKSRKRVEGIEMLAYTEASKTRRGTSYGSHVSSREKTTRRGTPYGGSTLSPSQSKKTIREARKKPLLDLLQEIRRQCMTRNFTRSNMATDRKTRFTMKTHQELDMVEKKCHECILCWAIGPETEVEYQDQCYVVNLEKETCSCRGWQMNGIPCIHAGKVILRAKRKLSEIVAECYTTSKWRETYSYGIRHVNGMIKWSQTNRLGVIPPPNRTGNPGRPKNHDIKKGANETKSTTKMSRANKVMTCSNCKEEGHYQNRCNKGYVPSPAKKPRGRPRKYQGLHNEASQAQSSQAQSSQAHSSQAQASPWEAPQSSQGQPGKFSNLHKHHRQERGEDGSL